jgi:hypothetical protein
MSNIQVPLETGGSFVIDPVFWSRVKVYAPFTTNNKGEVMCKKGKLINAMKTQYQRFQQIQVGKNFSSENIQATSTIPVSMNYGSYYAIPLGGAKGFGKTALIDADMLDIVMAHSWHYNGGYAKSGNLLMHRVIMCHHRGDEAVDGYMIDHISGNRLDNRLENLSIKTAKGNAKNRTNDPKYGRFVGVEALADGTYATVHKKIQITIHAIPDMCALCYDSVMFYCYGQGCRMNDNKSSQPLDIRYWNLPPEIMTKLNSWRDKHTDYEGVSHVGGKWKATLKLDLGTFETKHEAAQARDAAVILFGQKHHLNFEQSEQLRVARELLERLYR